MRGARLHPGACRRGLWIGIGLLLGLTTPVAGLMPPTAFLTTPAASPADTLFRPAGRTAVAALGIAFPAGPERDPVGREGAAWVIAQSMRMELARRLGTDPAHVTLEMERAYTGLVVQVSETDADRALDVLRQVVLEDPLPRNTVEDARIRSLDQLRFQAGAPTLEYDLELARFLHGVDSRWTHRALGSAESVAALDPGEVAGIRARIFPAQEARWAVVRGPAPVADTRPAAPPPVSDSAVSGSPVEARSQPAAVEAWRPQWLVGDRLVITREITNAWVAVAYPLDPALPPAHRDLLVQALSEALNPLPPDPGLFDGDVWVEMGAGGPILILQATVFPSDALRWEARILDEVEGLAANPPVGAFYSFMARRQRTARALLASDPGALALRLLRDGDSGPSAAVPSRNELGAAAGGLGPAKILLYGPDLSQDGSR